MTDQLYHADAALCDHCGELTDTADLWVHNQEVWCTWCITIDRSSMNEKEVKDGRV